MLTLRTFLLGLVFIATPPVVSADETQLSSSALEEILYRVEVYRQMDFPAEQILNNVETSISGRERSAIMAYGATPEIAIENFLAAGRGRRRVCAAEGDLRRARRVVLDCLAQDLRLNTFRTALAQTLENPWSMYYRLKNF